MIQKCIEFTSLPIILPYHESYEDLNVLMTLRMYPPNDIMPTSGSGGDDEAGAYASKPGTIAPTLLLLC